LDEQVMHVNTDRQRSSGSLDAPPLDPVGGARYPQAHVESSSPAFVPHANQRVGYMIPEFPGQTHIWMWREIQWMKRWGVPLQIYSTRRPPERDRARHAWSSDAQAQTVYLWPVGVGRVIVALLWALFTRPVGLWRCFALARSLPVESSGKRKRPRLWQLIVPACVLARDAKSRGITRFHAHTCSNAAILCMMTKRLIGTPFSLTLNANINWWGGAMAEKFADADFTIAITQWLLDEMKRDYPQLRDEQRLLGRIGVDTDKWTPDASRATSAGGAMRIFSLGRLHISKGHWVLLRAMKLLRDRGIETTLRVAGDGPERANIEALINELGIGDCVTLLGSQSEDVCIAEMRGADVFVLSSDAEPLGVVYMEAMSAGVPTVGTAAGGVAEIITNGVDGVLVPPKSPDALADALEQLARDPQRRESLGKAGRESIIRNFDARIGASTLYERMFGATPR
jgi:glycosyltransferase involved in cell wall biosynthesis